MILKIYKCFKCNEEFIVLDNIASYCINCGNKSLIVKLETAKFSLYNNDTQMLQE